jgi:hypothetical protein
MMQRWVADSLFVVVLSNNGRSPVPAIATALAAVALDEPYELPRVKTPVSLPPGSLAQYEGRYRLAGGVIRTVQRREGGLVAIRGEGPAYPILPEGPDRFYFAHDPMTTLQFLRDEHGRIAAHVLRQAFAADTARRISG